MPEYSEQHESSCKCTIIHKDIVENVKCELPKTESIHSAAEFFKIFSDTTRLKILCALNRSEMCGCDISAILGMTQSAVSHQMRVLKQTGLVRQRRDGKVVYFSLDDEHISNVLKIGLEHISE